MSSPLPTMVICLCYVYFVKSLGPNLMRNRQPFQMKTPILIYNAIQVIFSSIIVYKALKHGWWFSYDLRCQPVDYSLNPEAVTAAHVSWWYWFSKFFEFLDTIFFVLRKKNDQITNLHVIHHGIMPAAVWWGIKFAPGGHGTFFGLLNSAVHVVMYSYYLLAAMGPRFHKYLWWKKHLTTMQMIQFAAVFIHSSQALFNGCNYPKILSLALCFHSILFFSLFANFYIQAYIKRRRLPAVVATSTAVTTDKEKQKKKEKGAESTLQSIQSTGKNLGEAFIEFATRFAAACSIDQNALYHPHPQESKSHHHHHNHVIKDKRQ